MLSSGKKRREPDGCGMLGNLWQLVQSVLDESEPNLDALGLTPKTLFLLTAVEEHPFPAEIARGMHLPAPTVTYMIKQLEEKGLLQRQSEPGDLRKFRLVYTEAGRGTVRRGNEAVSAVLMDRLRRLDPSDILAFDRILRQLVEKTGEE